MRNDSGKALTIFLVLISVIFVSLTAIAVFLLVKQVQLRESAEGYVFQLQTSESVLRAEVQEMKKQNDILERRIRETDEKIESLLEELDLAQGVRDEVRKENRELKDSLDGMRKANEEMRVQLARGEQAAEQRVNDLQGQLTVALERNKTLEDRRQSLEKEHEDLKERLSAYQAAAAQAPAAVSEPQEDGVNLAPIVVSPADSSGGRIVSVDHEAEFVIVNMGARHGSAVGTVLSVSSGNAILGDLKVTRVLPEMSAADVIPPLKVQDISEGDSVKLK